MRTLNDLIQAYGHKFTDKEIIVGYIQTNGLEEEYAYITRHLAEDKRQAEDDEWIDKIADKVIEKIGGIR